jgi:hypothetical protein
VIEDEAGTLAGGKVEGLHGVGEAAGLVDHGRNAVAQAVHLVEAAGLELRGHQEDVRRRLDPVGEVLIVATVEPGLAGEALLERMEELLVARLAAPHATRRISRWARNACYSEGASLRGSPRDVLQGGSLAGERVLQRMLPTKFMEVAPDLRTHQASSSTTQEHG